MRARITNQPAPKTKREIKNVETAKRIRDTIETVELINLIKEIDPDCNVNIYPSSARNVIDHRSEEYKD